MAEPTNALFPQPELRQWDAPWYKRIPYAITDALYGPNATAPQGQAVNKLFGTDNPLNVFGQAQESGEMLGRGVKFGDAAALGLGVLGSALAIAGVKTKPSTINGYRGSASNKQHFKEEADAFWASDKPEVASAYALDPHSLTASTRNATPNIMPVEFRFKNPLVVDARGANYMGAKYGDNVGTDSIAGAAIEKGHDGLVMRNIYDPPSVDSKSGQELQTTIAALQRGTVFSKLTGEQLFSLLGLIGAGSAAASGQDANASPVNRLFTGAP